MQLVLFTSAGMVCTISQSITKYKQGVEKWKPIFWAILSVSCHYDVRMTFIKVILTSPPKFNLSQYFCSLNFLEEFPKELLGFVLSDMTFFAS